MIPHQDLFQQTRDLLAHLYPDETSARRVIFWPG